MNEKLVILVLQDLCTWERCWTSLPRRQCAASVTVRQLQLPSHTEKEEAHNLTDRIVQGSLFFNDYCCLNWHIHYAPGPVYRHSLPPLWHTRNPIWAAAGGPGLARLLSLRGSREPLQPPPDQPSPVEALQERRGARRPQPGVRLVSET